MNKGKKSKKIMAGGRAGMKKMMAGGRAGMKKMQAGGRSIDGNRPANEINEKNSW
jgi:hypothetical protein